MTDAPETVQADLVYAVDTGEKLVNQTMPAGDMSRVVTGTYEMHPRNIRNGRLWIFTKSVNLCCKNYL